MFPQSHSVKSNLTARPSSENTGPMSRSTTTSKPSPPKSSRTSTSSQLAIHASRSVLPGSAEARRMTAISGRKFIGSWLPSGPPGAFLKTCLVTSLWASTKSYLTWKMKATPQGRLYLELFPSMPRTDDSGSGLWPTPDAHMASGGRTFAPGTVSPTGKDLRTGNKRSVPLNAAVQMRPTPPESAKREWEKRNLRGIAHTMWPTASARDWKDNPGSWMYGATNPDGSVRKREDQLPRAVYAQMWPTPSAGGDAGGPTGLAGGSGNRKKLYGMVGVEEGKKMGSGSLSPQWVEWLMGYPIGYTDLKDWETPLSRRSSRSSSQPSASKRDGD